MSEVTKRLLIALFFMVISALCFYITIKESHFSYSITLPGFLMLGISIIFFRNLKK
jgi:hypothetical protein